MNTLGFKLLSPLKDINQPRNLTVTVEGIELVGADGSSEMRIARRSERIESMDFSREGDAPAPDILRLARGAE
jgi:hypothetical protein